MDTIKDRRYGNALIAGSVLAALTMMLHPAGGSWEHLLNIANLIMGTHSLALVAIAFTLVGFAGLKRQLQQNEFYSCAAFTLTCIAVFAGMCAGILNGLALPIFMHHFKDAAPDVLVTAKAILVYNTALNHAFDLVFIGGNCIAVLLWSIAILKTKIFPLWTAYFGLLLSLTAVVAMIAGVVLLNLHGFTLFILGYVSWTVVVGILMRRML